MTDLEICIRIAEIEGLIVSNHNVGGDDVWVHTCNYTNSSVVLFNPLTDKALCFELMVKYNVVYLDGMAYADCIDGPGPEGGGYYCGGLSTGETPQEAICLAIIKYKELNHE